MLWPDVDADFTDNQTTEFIHMNGGIPGCVDGGPIPLPISNDDPPIWGGSVFHVLSGQKYDYSYIA